MQKIRFSHDATQVIMLKQQKVNIPCIAVPTAALRTERACIDRAFHFPDENRQKMSIKSMILTVVIVLSCSCIVYPLSPHSYKVKGIHYFLFFALKYSLWVLFRTASLTEAVLTCTHNPCFEQKYKIDKKIQLKIVIFTAVNNRCMLHGRVFVMSSLNDRNAPSIMMSLSAHRTSAFIML